MEESEVQSISRQGDRYMDTNIIKETIANVGFPASCVLALGWYIQKRDKQQTEERKEERQILLDEIEFNRQVNNELLNTNKILASDIKIELQDIKNEIKHISDKE